MLLPRGIETTDPVLEVGKQITVLIGNMSAFHITVGESGPMFSNSFLAAEPFF